MARYITPGESTFDLTFDFTFQGAGTPIRGSIGGATFQRIGNSRVIRHRMAPVNKRTPRQTHSRNRFDSLQKFWRMIDSLDKQTFRDEAANYPRTSSLGNEYIISGINLQQSSNTFRLAAGQSKLTSMPSPVAFPDFFIAVFQIDVSTPVIRVELSPLQVPTNFACFIYMTRPLSPGQLSSEELYKFIDVYPPGQNTSTPDLYDAYLDAHGEIDSLVGQQVHVVCHLSSLITGQPGQRIDSNTFIV